MQWLRGWIFFLFVFEVILVTKLLTGQQSVTEYFVNVVGESPSGTEGLKYYVVFLVSLLGLIRLFLALDMHNVNLYRLNVVAHIVEAIIFGVMGYQVGPLRFPKYILDLVNLLPDPIAFNKLILQLGIFVINPLWLLLSYRSYTAPRRREHAE